MEIKMRPTTGKENIFTYTQSKELQKKSACIGHLRADMDTDGEGFFYSWEDHYPALKVDTFKDEFDEVINRFRFGEKDKNGKRNPDDFCFLKNRTELMKYCGSHPELCMDEGSNNYGIRLETDKYVYLMRLNPTKGEYNLYCYCYKRDWFDQHLRNTEHGIRFTDNRYYDLFKIPDGGRIRITFPDGHSEVKTCRFVDSYHFELGSGPRNLFHICEFYEVMKKNNNKVEPIDLFPGTKRVSERSAREAR